LEQRETEKRLSDFNPSADLYSAVDFAGIGLDITLFLVLSGLDVSFNLSQMISCLLAAGFVVAAKFKRAQTQENAFEGRRWLPAVGLSAFAALFLRAGLLAVLIQRLSWPPYIAILLAAIVAGAVNATTWRFFVTAGKPGRLFEGSTHPALMRALIVYALLLKLFYLGLPEIMHEEGYYWNYAQHLDFGYLDHPPMVGWVIWICTHLLGDSEFAVRLGAFALWFLGAFYLFRLTRNIFGRETAVRALMLFAVLPYFFGVSFVVLPDAPLVACWSAAMYYLYRMLIRADPHAFIGIGVFIGLGLLSKYTIVLLGFAALVFVLVDPPSRKWLRSYRLWLAIVIAILIFTPVLIWNAAREWVSFHFQGTGHVIDSFDFDLPDIIGAVLILITPMGLMATVAIARSKRFFEAVSKPGTPVDMAGRTYRLLIMLTAMPLLVFVFFSLFRNTKLIWTGPIWLGILPLMAAMMSPGMEKHKKRLPVFGPRPWTKTTIVLLLLYGAGLHYLSLGIPGIPFPSRMLGQGYHDISCQVEAIVEEIEDASGMRPLVVGMDGDVNNSWLAFYRGKCGRRAGGYRSNSGAYETAGPHLFSGVSGMYLFWFPREEQAGKTMVLVGDERKELAEPKINIRIKSGGKIKELTAKAKGRTIRRNYYQIVEGYQP
jgi:dolichol-phosphate mannosyltransferase